MSIPTSFVASGLSPGLCARLARVAKRLRQYEVAQLAGVPPSAVSALENDRDLPPVWRRRIGQILDLDDSER